MASVFNTISQRIFKHRYEADLLVYELHGGVPADPETIRRWIETYVKGNDTILKQMVADTLRERGLGGGEAPSLAVLDEAIDAAVENKVVGFKRMDGFGSELYFEGRAVKACIKEAASIAVGAGHINGRGWGTTRKGMLGYLSEHVFVLEDKIPLGVTEPSGVRESFVHSFRVNAIKREEYVTNAKLSFTVVTDHLYDDETWGIIWATAEKNGIGASRSMSFGQFEVTRWEKVN